MAARTYTILPYPLADPSVWDVVIQEGATCQKNLARDEVVLKYEGPTPDLLAGAPKYTHAEILEIMRTPEWPSPALDPEGGTF